MHHHLAIAASSAVSVPSFSAATQRSTKVSAMVISVSISASWNRLFWKLPIFWPKAVRSLQYSTVQPRIDRACATPANAIDSRSWGRFLTSSVKP